VSPVVGWGLATLVTALAWVQYGGRGVALAVGVIVFWLLLQFGRMMRVLQRAGRHPVGAVASAAMLQAGLRRGMTLLEVVQRTQSLGERLGQADDSGAERWCWHDAGGAAVELELRRGRLVAWSLQRADRTSPAGAPGAVDGPEEDAAGRGGGVQPAAGATAPGQSGVPAGPSAPEGAPADSSR
jgi:hypothetical protein